jgi:ribosomal protein L21E
MTFYWRTKRLAMRRYRKDRNIRRIAIKLPVGAFVEVIEARYDWHRLYMGRTGTVIGETIQTDVYEVQFSDENGSGCFDADNLRLV